MKKCASNIATRSELGRYPIDNFIKTQSLLFEDRLCNSETPSILKECYNLTKLLDSKGIFSWYTYVNHVRKQLKLQAPCTFNSKKSK